MKVLTIIGARPQFIKASAVSRAIAAHREMNASRITEVLLHTGQHYDEKMSDIFFKQLAIPMPKYNLGIMEKTHGAMTGKMLERIETILLDEKPDVVLVYGDTNSTLAGALAAVKLHIPIAHVEAGLRSFNRKMPEEINRILTDTVADFLFCPTETAVAHLASEGIKNGVHNVGDVMYDVVMHYKSRAEEQFSLIDWDLEEREYVLCTVHRAENTDVPGKLEAIFSALQQISREKKVVLPLHPRTRNILDKQNILHYLDGLQIIEPVSYLEMARLQMSAFAVLTDSGGMQKEAFFHKVPCLTLREETEWVETVQLGWNRLCGADKGIILQEWKTCVASGQDVLTHAAQEQPYGDAAAAEAIVRLLVA